MTSIIPTVLYPLSLRHHASMTYFVRSSYPVLMYIPEILYHLAPLPRLFSEH